MYIGVNRTNSVVQIIAALVTKPLSEQMFIIVSWSILKKKPQNTSLLIQHIRKSGLPKGVILIVGSDEQAYHYSLRHTCQWFE